MDKPTFSTTNLATAAALLSTGKVKYVGLQDDPHSNRKLMLLTPREKAKALYKTLLEDKLMINASKNGMWIAKLKADIFGRDVKSY